MCGVPERVVPVQTRARCGARDRVARARALELVDDRDAALVLAAAERRFLVAAVPCDVLKHVRDCRTHDAERVLAQEADDERGRRASPSIFSHVVAAKFGRSAVMVTVRPPSDTTRSSKRYTSAAFVNAARRVIVESTLFHEPIDSARTGTGRRMFTHSLSASERSSNQLLMKPITGASGQMTDHSAMLPNCVAISA